MIEQEAVPLQRINVVGCSGSGKSTLARRLSARLGHPYVELDALFWKPNWTESSDDELRARLEASLAGDTWVLDGNYQRTQPVKWRRVQTVIWLDLPLWRIMMQVTARTIRRSIRQEELWSGNRDSLRKAFFSRDSIILWAFTTAGNYRRRYERDTRDPSLGHIHFVRLRSHREAEAFIAAI